jgi:hypothetical protein
MEKKTIETFIKKYSLGGLFTQVRWNVNSNELGVTAMTADKKCLTSVKLKKFDGVTDSVIGIVDSAKLKQMLGAVGDTMSLVAESDPNDATRILSLIISDDKREVRYTTADIDVIPAEPKLKPLPPFEVEIVLNDEFVDSFSSAKSALPEAELFTLVMNKKKSKLELVLGYGKNNYNRVSFEVPSTTAGKDTVKAPISFSAKTLKAILEANSEVKDAVLKVCEQGLAFVEFDQDGFQSQYYMVRVELED